MASLCSDTLYVSFRDGDVDRERARESQREPERECFSHCMGVPQLASGRTRILSGAPHHKVLPFLSVHHDFSFLTPCAWVRVGDTDL